MPIARQATPRELAAAEAYVRQHYPAEAADSAKFRARLQAVLAALQLIGPIGDAARLTLAAEADPAPPRPTPPYPARS